MPEQPKFCSNCKDSYSAADPELARVFLGRMTEAGFSCTKPIIQGNPFTTPLPSLKKFCGFDVALHTALEEAGYPDTETENSARQAFLRGVLELRPLPEAESPIN
jgi:hypothetical protein